MDYRWTWTVVAIALWYAIVRLRRRSVIKTLCIAILVHLGVIALLGGFTPLIVLKRIPQLIRLVSETDSGPLWQDPGSPVAILILLLRWSDPDMFRGSLSRWWAIGCVVLFCRPIISVMRIAREVWHYLLYVAGMNEIYERPLASAYFLAACLAMSIFISELSTALLQYGISTQRSDRYKTPLRVDTDIDPVSPYAPGRFPWTPWSSIATKTRYHPPYLEDTEDEGPRYVGSRSTGSVIFPALKENPIRPALKNRKLPTRQWDTVELPALKDTFSPANTPISPWSLPSVWVKLLRGVRSPGVTRNRSFKPPWSPDIAREVKIVKHETGVSVGTQTHDTPVESANQIATRQLGELQRKLTDFMVQHQKLRGTRHLDPTYRVDAYCYLSETVEREVVLKLHEIKVEEDETISLRRKTLLDQAQALLADLEERIWSPPVKNPIYGEESDLIQAAAKIIWVLCETHEQCESWAGSPPQLHEVSGDYGKLAQVCANIFWTSEFVNELSESSEQVLARLPDDLFDLIQPDGVLDGIRNSLGAVLKKYNLHPDVIPVGEMGMLPLGNIALKLGELLEHLNSPLSSDWIVGEGSPHGGPTSGSRSTPQSPMNLDP